MSDYRAATGSDIALGSLTVLSPQPRSEGLKYTRVTYSANGVAYPEGAYVELVWDYLADASEYSTVLTVFGLNAADSALVTVYVRNDLFASVRYNGRAVRPHIGQSAAWEQMFPRNVTILVRDLEVAS